jgi:hypothetical protein
VLTRDGFLYILSPETDDLATHPDVVAAIFKWSAERSSAAVKTAAAAAPATPAESYYAAAGHQPQLPPPPLPPHIMSMAAAMAANVSDMLADGDGEAAHAHTPEDAAAAAAAHPAGTAMAAVGAPAARALERARRAAAPPSVVFPMTASTKLTFAPSVHTDAFEVADTTGFFGFTNKVLLRATSAEDMVDWVLACNGAIDLVNLGTAAAATGGEP